MHLLVLDYPPKTLQHLCMKASAVTNYRRCRDMLLQGQATVSYVTALGSAIRTYQRQITENSRELP